jgi:peptide/nickel transport system ATP-binding protein
VTPPLLRVEDLHVTYPGGVPAVRGVDLELASGQRLGLAGESGSGKSSLALALLRLLPPGTQVSGRVLLGGEDVLTMGWGRLRSVRWAGAAVVFQGALHALDPVRRIGDQIAEPVLLHERGVSRAAAARRAQQLLERVGIPAARARAYPHQLSGGQRQRVMIAMALACGPDLLIADEPTTALDVMVQAQVLALLRELVEERGIGLLMISHDLAVLAQTCDRLAVMYAGRVVEEGPAARLFADARHPYSAALGAAFPHVGEAACRRRPRGLPGDPPDPQALPPGCAFHPRCARATAQCATEEPRLCPAGTDHHAACLLLNEDDQLHYQGREAETFAAPPRGRDQPRTPEGLSRAEVALSQGREELREQPSSTGLHGWSRSSSRPLDGATSARESPSGLRGHPLGSSRPWVSATSRRSKVLLSAEDLSVHFPARAVDGVTLDLRESEILALLGESGCGKSTLARALLGLVPPTRGHVRFLGAPLPHRSRALRAFRRAAQLIPQDPAGALNPRHTVYDAVAEGLRVHGGAPDEPRRVAAALARAGLRPPERFFLRYPHELSGGQRQRVLIAGALVLEPRLLIADEPVASLDASVRGEILALLQRLRDDLGLAALVVTHDLGLAWNIADRVAVMYLGRIVETGPAEQVLTAPRHPYTRALLSVLPGRAGGAPPTLLSGEPPDPSRVPGGCRFHLRCPVVADGRAAAAGVADHCRTVELPVLAAGDAQVACHWAAAT